MSLVMIYTLYDIMLPIKYGVCCDATATERVYINIRWCQR